MKYLIATALWFMAATHASSQTGANPVLAEGTCDGKSGVTIDDGELNKFSCDVAVIARTDRGSVLIQFTDKRGDDGRILGFAGTIEGKQGFGADLAQIVGIERIYLAAGADPIPVSRGSCFMNWTGLQRTGGKITSVVCGAAAQAEGSDIKALVALKVK